MPIWATALLSCLLLAGLETARRIHRRVAHAGGAPERGLSEGLLVLLVGYAAWVARATAADRVAPEVSFQITMCAYLVVAAGASLLYLGVSRLYRPDSTTARAAAWLGVVALVASWCGQALADRGVETTMASLWGMLFICSQAVAMAWWGAESLLYHARMQRRVALDLADPVTADRFRVTAHAAFALASVFLLAALCPFLLARPAREVPALLAVIALLSSYAAACLYCALRSPHFYRQLVVSRAGTPARLGGARPS